MLKEKRYNIMGWFYSRRNTYLRVASFSQDEQPGYIGTYLSTKRIDPNFDNQSSNGSLATGKKW